MLDNIFEIFYIIGFITGSVIRALGTRQHKRNTVTDDHETTLGKLLLFPPVLGMFAIPLLYVLTPWLDFAGYQLPTWAGWAGGGVFAVALWLLWRSHIDLGRNWLPMLQIREGHSLVTQGVFHSIRHPMYAAHGLWGIAQALLLQNWIAGLAMLAFSLPLYLWRVPREEQMMVEYFGEQYRQYMNRTGRFIPRLWR